MKKETIFKHELNESMAANAAMSCLKNRNKHQQMNEAVSVIAGLIRLAMPLLRPIITKLVRGMIMKAGAKLTGRQVAKAVIKNVSNGKTLMKIGKKVGQTWTELPSELKDEITKTAINTFNELRTKKSEPQIATQEQEEETSAFDERFAYRKDLRDMANDVTKKAYMIIRKEYGDSMWRRLHMDDCDERGLISQMNDYQKYYNITNPQDIADCMLGRKSVRNFKKSREEQEEVKNYRDKLPGQYEEYVLPDIVDMVSDKGISEEEVKARLLATPELPWEYDEIEEWVAKNFAEEEEETTLSESELEDLTFKLADYLLESFIILEDEDEDYSNLLEAVEKILKKDAPKSNTVAGYYAWCRKWFMKIEDLTYSYYNEPNPESYYSDEDEETADDKYAIAKQVMANYNPDTDEWEDPSVWLLYAIQDHIGKQFLGMPKKELKSWKQAIDATITEYEKEQEEHSEDADNLQSQLANAWDEGMEDDEDDYVPYNNTFDETHHDIVDTILDEVHRYFQFETDVEGFNLTEYTDEQIGKAIEQILDKTGDFPSSVNNNVCYAWVKKYAGKIIKALETGSLENPYEGHPEFNFSEQEEIPSMERHDVILALTEYMSESWIDAGDDGDLDDIYYAVADILDETGDYPESTDWSDCKPWCQKHYKEVEARIYNEEEEAACTTKVTVRTPMGMKQMNLSTEVIEAFVKQTGSNDFSDRSAVRVIAGIVKEMAKKGYTPTDDEQKIVDIQNKKIKQGIASRTAATDRSMNALSD